MALSDDDRAALSAYLDGELDDDATHRIEVRLTSEPELRFEYETIPAVRPGSAFWPVACRC
jgi:anti-sigma factor RsiW